MQGIHAEKKKVVCEAEDLFLSYFMLLVTIQSFSIEHWIIISAKKRIILHFATLEKLGKAVNFNGLHKIKSFKGAYSQMNNEYVARAKEQIEDPKELITVAMKRANQLALGAKPMIKTQDDKFIDVALLEISEGLLGVNYLTEETEESVVDELSSVLDDITID